MKSRVILAVAAGAVLALAGSAAAFHSGGVAECEGCHTMHNSEGNTAMGNAPHLQGHIYLLQGADASSTCLNCHEGSAGTSGRSYHIFNSAVAVGAAPDNYSPGGDFAWLTKTYTWSPRAGTTETSDGERKAHNVVALDFGLVADGELTTAPGGTYDGGVLACNSCHDPHGKTRVVDALGTLEHPWLPGDSSLPIRTSGSYGAEPNAISAVGTYRLLGGDGYEAKSTGYVFTAEAPIAGAPALNNKAETTANAGGIVTGNRVAYGQGMSEWCANCHTNLLNNSYVSGTVGPDPTNKHPAGNSADLTVAVIDNYNAYVKTADFTGGSATAYTSLVPFEKGTAVRADLLADTLADKHIGAETGDNVMCLTCHRAHASGFDSITRWNQHATFLTEDTSLGIGYSGSAGMMQGRSEAELTGAYYGRPGSTFANYQRNLCSKCHLKD